MGPGGETEKGKCIEEGVRGKNLGYSVQKDGLYAELWKACAGPLVNVPGVGDMVFYFPQGHVEQVELYTNQDGRMEMPIYNLPPKILCKVVHIQLQAETLTDEVFAQITLLPETNQDWEFSSSEDGSGSSPTPPQKTHAYAFSKILTPSDTSTHGGFSVPKRHADECLPPLDMSQQPPVQELVAKDLHGFEWHFRHIYRGQPRRHLLTSGWSIFVTSKKLVAGDTCIFLRGENGDLHIGIRRAAKLQNNTSAALISGHSIKHGILASAFHAFSTRAMFTVYYRPWTSPSEFIIPFRKYIKSAETVYSIGTRFRMVFEVEESAEQRFSGTIVGVEDIDRVRWPGSEWRCLKVQWDAKLEMLVRPERVSPWNIVPSGVTKRRHSSMLPQPKRLQPHMLSPKFSPFVRDGTLKTSTKYTPESHSGVLQGQEMRATDTHESGTVKVPLLPHMASLLKPEWSHLQGPEIQHMHAPFDQHGGSAISFRNGCPPSLGVANSWPLAFTSYRAGDAVGAYINTSVTNVNSISSESTEQKAHGEKNCIDAPLAQENLGDKYKLFGVTIFSSSRELPSQQYEITSGMHTLYSVPPAGSQSSISESIQASDPLKSTSSILPEKKCNCCSIIDRTCTKVLKYGTALGRSVNLTHFDGYDELICELDQLFTFRGGLIDGSSGWQVTYTDDEGDVMLMGGCPWEKFLSSVRKMNIYPKDNIDQLILSELNPTAQ